MRLTVATRNILCNLVHVFGNTVNFSRDFIELACNKGVLRFGEFVTKAGRLSPYFFNAGLFNDGASFGQLCDFYARTLVAADLPCDMLFGPAYKGIPLVAGTAMRLAERGHSVTLVTPEAMVGRELVRTSADFPLRRRLRALDVTFQVESAIARWHGDAADLLDLVTGRTSRIEADSLVMAGSRQAADWLVQDLARMGIPFTAIGDCTAPRQDRKSVV